MSDTISAKTSGGGKVSRRNFIIGCTGTIAVASLEPKAAFAGPFESREFATLVPPNKHLHPEWVKSLTARGEPEVYSKARGELRYIGMPVGGLFAGTLYLSGDGKLWYWGIFNETRLGISPRTVDCKAFGKEFHVNAMGGANYAHPLQALSPVEQGFALKVGDQVRNMDSGGWTNVTFRGEYPVATVTYTDSGCPIAAELTSFSPFCPLDTENSALPLTVCEWTLTNTSSHEVQAIFGGWLQNAVGIHTASASLATRTATCVSEGSAAVMRFGIEPAAPEESPRPNVVIDDFQRAEYSPWKVTGTAFGTGPVLRSSVPSYMGDLGGVGDRIVNSHASAPGTDAGQRDSAVGTLTSPSFTVQRNFIQLFVGGGSDAKTEGVRILIGGKQVFQASGSNSNVMRMVTFAATQYIGKEAVIEIYDEGTGPWGNVGVSHIIQTDRPGLQEGIRAEADYGTMAFSLLQGGTCRPNDEKQALFTGAVSKTATLDAGEPMVGTIGSEIKLAPGESKVLTYFIAWHFPNCNVPCPDAITGPWYGERFASAGEVVSYAISHYARLKHNTLLWRDTWYDSTLPYWFLDRTMANTSILATSTSHRFGSGRFWAWEGVGCCEGTCTHVWQYAQAPARLFPDIERHLREFVDLGVAFYPQTGIIGYRGEGTGAAVDGQAGRILGTYREYTMTVDRGFLQRIWLRLRKAMEYLIQHDSNQDGLLDGPQPNTLDADWYGEIAWISGLYSAALAACHEMAEVVGDTEFALRCKHLHEQSRSAIENRLFNGEYFIQLHDPTHYGALGTYGGCHIDQVMGQSWAWQAGLGRVLDKDKTLSALHALYKYNFAPDVGPFRRKNTEGRLYALEGDGGLIMATNPQEVKDEFGDVSAWQYGYFNECMSGFEHQAASHMVAEGMVEEGLAVTRAIHDRYHPARRNPYNEVECSDHYSRAMASYGTFISACGFVHNAQQGLIGFHPAINPHEFRCAFTSAVGWGSYSQHIHASGMTSSITIKYGRLSIKTFSVAGTFSSAHFTINAVKHEGTVQHSAGKTIVNLGDYHELHPDTDFRVELIS